MVLIGCIDIALQDTTLPWIEQLGVWPVEMDKLFNSINCTEYGVHILSRRQSGKNSQP